MGLVDDFLLLPDWMKYLTFMSILLGTTVAIPFFGISFGTLINPLISTVLGGFGLNFSFKGIVIIIFFGFAIIFMLAMKK